MIGSSLRTLVIDLLLNLISVNTHRVVTVGLSCKIVELRKRGSHETVVGKSHVGVSTFGSMVKLLSFVEGMSVFLLRASVVSIDIKEIVNCSDLLHEELGRESHQNLSELVNTDNSISRHVTHAE